MLTLPAIIPANQALFRITQWAVGITVTCPATDKNTGAVTRWRLAEYSGNSIVPVKVDGGWSAEYSASPYLYNAYKNGSLSCCCPTVRMKGVFKTAKDAIFAAMCAKSSESQLLADLKGKLPAPGTLPATPVVSAENNWNNSRYDA